MQDEQLAAEHAWVLQAGDRSSAKSLEPRGALDEPARQNAPVEDLTAKELEVLGHLSQMLSTEEIAAVMYISVNTVRTHVRNILRKLGVSRRNAAVRLARDLELIPG